MPSQYARFFDPGIIKYHGSSARERSKIFHKRKEEKEHEREQEELQRARGAQHRKYLIATKGKAGTVPKRAVKYFSSASTELAFSLSCFRTVMRSWAVCNRSKASSGESLRRCNDPSVLISTLSDSELFNSRPVMFAGRVSSPLESNFFSSLSRTGSTLASASPERLGITAES